MDNIDKIEDLETFLLKSPISNVYPDFLKSQVNKSPKFKLEKEALFSLVETSMRGKSEAYLIKLAAGLNISGAFCRNENIVEYFLNTFNEKILVSLLSNPTLDPRNFLRVATSLYKINSWVFNGLQVKNFPTEVDQFFERICKSPRLTHLHKIVARAYKAPHKAYEFLFHLQTEDKQHLEEIHNILVQNTFMPLFVIAELQKITTLDSEGNPIMVNGRPVYKYDQEIIKNMIFRYPDLALELTGDK